MKRRDFLSITIPATGAVLMTSGLLDSKAFAEINRQFSGKADFDAYDVVINGAGLSGYFAALEAAKQNKKVLVVERRTSPGFEIAAKGKLWLDVNGLDKFNAELVQLFFPEGERQEMKNTGGKGPGSSQFGEDALLFSGSIRKGLLRNLLINKVHVLLMTDVCGVLTDDKKVQGVMLASKHGLHAVKCKSFIDASDQVLFSRGLFDSPYTITNGSFVLELSKVENPSTREVMIPADYGVAGNKLRFKKGKRSESQLFIEYEFPVKSQRPEEIEHQARRIAAALGKNLEKLDSSLKNAEISQFPLETSYELANTALPEARVQGYYMLSYPAKDLSCSDVMKIESDAKALVKKIQYARTISTPGSVLMVGARIPYSALKVTALHEPGLSVPLSNVRFDFEKLIPHQEQCQVLVAGGGTGGAFAANGAAEKGANTIVVDYFNDLGGTKTMGGVMGYYHGVRDNKFFKKQSEDAERLAFETNMSKKTGRKLYHLTTLLGADGRFLTGAIMCDALVSDNLVKGIVVCRNGKLEVITAHVTIDATGDGDIAAFAGAEYKIGSSRTGETQNYSQWDIPGEGKLPSPTNRDYDIIDNTKISELQRGLFISHYEAHFYDFHPMLTVRESRRIMGEHVLDFIDVAEKTHFEDIISLASSDFDPHNIGSSEYSKCGFLLPHSNDVVVEVPYRAIVPKRLDGLLISGRGISQTHNALQFTRMTADIIVLGYLTGQIAAELSLKNRQPRGYDISSLQKEWASLEYLPADYSRKTTYGKREEQQEVVSRIEKLAAGHREYLFEVSRLPKEKALPVLIDHCSDPVEGSGKLLVSKALAWFGNPEGNDLIEAELQDMFKEEQKAGYPGGYVDDYDFIRGREKNVLEGLFWRINQNIGLLAMTGKPSANKTIQHILENTESGGGMVMRSNDYYNGRIDLKIIPFYNRIMNLCFYAERIPDQSFISGFEKLLKDKNVGGFKTDDYTKVRWRVYGGLLEVSIAAAMARCGSQTGYNLLTDYLNDTHYNFKTFAASELRDITGHDFAYDAQAWKKFASRLSYPAPVKKLVKTTIEV